MTVGAEGDGSGPMGSGRNWSSRVDAPHRQRGEASPHGDESDYVLASRRLYGFRSYKAKVPEDGRERKCL
jgi:hypothetical protein